MSAFSREIDEKIDNYCNYLETVSPTERPHIQFMIHNAKLMKNKLTAMLAELDVLIAENNLKAAVEQLETFKKYHSKEAESIKSSSPILESAKNKTQKESKLKAMSSTDTGKNDTDAHTTGNIDKENTKPASSKSKGNKTSQDNQKAQKSYSVPDRGTKRRHSDSSRSSSQCEKKQKKSHTTDVNSNKSTNSKNSNKSDNSKNSNKSDNSKNSNKSNKSKNSSHTATSLTTNMATNSNKSDNSKNSNKSTNSNNFKRSTNSKNSSTTATLLRTNMSPIKKTSQYITPGVQTCNWLEQVKAADTCRRTNRQSVEVVPRRMLDDDECTVIIEDLSVKAPKTHKDAINISKALRQIMTPRTDLAKDQVTTDLTQMPVSASMKNRFLFEDELEKVKKLHVKSESPETGDDVFIL